MGDVEFDMSEVKELAVELKGLPAQLSRHATPVLKRAAQNIKDAMRTDFEGSSNAGFRRIAAHVSYDEPSAGVDGFEVEVGVDKGGAGSLANLAVFGSWKGGGTHEQPLTFAERELPEFESQLSALVDRIWS